jgi:hypothetical protein
MTAPDGIIEEHRSRLEPLYYVSHISQKDTDQEGSYHPLRGLTELVVRTYQTDNLDRETARLGIDAFTDIVEAVTDWFYHDRREWMHPSDFSDTREKYQYQPDQSPFVDGDQIFKRPVTKDIPRLAIKASQGAETDDWPNNGELDRRRATDCLDTLQYVHNRAAAAEDYRAAGNVNIGFRNVIDQSISAGTTSIAAEAWQKGLDTLPNLLQRRGEPSLAAREVRKSCCQMEKVHDFGRGHEPSANIPEGLSRRVYVFQYVEMVGEMFATPAIEKLDIQTSVETIRRDQSQYPHGMSDSPNAETIEFATSLYDGLCRCIELAWQFEQREENNSKGKEVRTTLTEACQTALEIPDSPLIPALVQLHIEAAVVLSSDQTARERWLDSFEKLVDANETEARDAVEYLENASSDDYPGSLHLILDVPESVLSSESDEFAEHLQQCLKVIDATSTNTFGEMGRN